jgi:hypothetical protein
MDHNNSRASIFVNLERLENPNRVNSFFTRFVSIFRSSSRVMTLPRMEMLEWKLDLMAVLS